MRCDPGDVEDHAPRIRVKGEPIRGRTGSFNEGRGHLIEPIHPAGLLLTGGASRRMGLDKASLTIAGVTLASRVARALREVAYPLVVAGDPCDTGLPSVTDRGEGPLAAIVDAAAHLPPDAPVVVAACDLPFIDGRSLETIIEALFGHDASVAVLDRRDQPLAACYSPRALAVARTLVAQRKRAMRDLIGAIDVARVEVRTALDVDTPEDYEAAKRILEAPQ